MVPCRICHIYGICGRKKVRRCSKVIILGDNASHKRVEAMLMRKGEFSTFNTAVLKLNCKSY